MCHNQQWQRLTHTTDTGLLRAQKKASQAAVILILGHLLCYLVAPLWRGIRKIKTWKLLGTFMHWAHCSKTQEPRPCLHVQLRPADLLYWKPSGWIFLHAFFAAWKPCDGLDWLWCTQRIEPYIVFWIVHESILLLIVLILNIDYFC